MTVGIPSYIMPRPVRHNGATADTGMSDHASPYDPIA
jgi:hypothetical protein